MEMETLPTELVAEILSYLPWTGLKRARLVCSLWYELSRNLISMKCAINADDVKKVCSDEFQNWLILNKIAFHTVLMRKNFDIKSLGPEEFEKFLNIFHSKTKQITLGSIYFPGDQFKTAILRCSNLECLEIATGSYHADIFDPKGVSELRQLKPFFNLTKFKIQLRIEAFQIGNVFQLLTNVMPNVENVDIQIHYYGNGNYETECKEVLIKFFKNQSSKLKILKLIGSDISTVVNCIIIPGLDLYELDIGVIEISSIDFEEEQNMFEAIFKMTKLKRLCFAELFIDGNILGKFTTNLKNLKTLCFDRCQFHNQILMKLKIENLELNGTQLAFYYVVEDLICKENHDLKSFKLTGDLENPRYFYSKLHNLKNLASLELHYMDYSITDICFQKIICNLKKLKILKFRGSGQITVEAIYDERDPNKCLSSLDQLEIFLLELVDSDKCLFSDVAVLEFLKLKHLKNLVIPYSELMLNFEINGGKCGMSFSDPIRIFGINHEWR